MVASSPSAVDVPTVSTPGAASLPPAPASGSRVAHLSAASPVGGVDRLVGYAVEPDPVIAFQDAMTWEVALIVLSVLAATALVATRLVEVLSDRGVGLRSRSFASGSDPAFEPDAPAAQVDARSYERLIAPDTPIELLSDEGRIIRILVENGGRAYQYRIVEETEWSKSKVSRLLSAMHERGQVDKVSVGRENVIVLADRVPTDDPDVPLH